MRLGRDGVAGLIGIGICLALLPYAYDLPRLPIVPIGPGFYPMLVLTFGAIMCALLVLQDVLAQRRPAAVTPEATEAAPSPAYGLVAAAFAVVGAYIALLPLIGFRLATLLFVAAFQAVLEPPRTLKQWAILLAVAVATTAVTYVAFNEYLTVLLPRGAWTGW